MNKNLNIFGLLVLGVTIGAVGTFSYLSLSGSIADTQQTGAAALDEPLYWVAPMDPNYTSDKAGKSPMGMDLIPVYKKELGSIDAGPGTILISPEVVNNLGVRTAKVELGLLHTKIETVGYVKYDEDQLVHVHPRVEGWIEKLYIKAAGDRVTEGQPLYEIYSPALVNAQEEFLLALDRKNSRLIQASRNRLKALQLPQNAITELKRSRKVKQNITFFAPQGGVVDNLNIREGFFVKPGNTLLSIGSLDQVWVDAEIFERQSSLVSTGLAVSMTLDYLPGKIWQGKVDYVYPTLDQQTRTLKVRLRFDNEQWELKPNMFAKVTIHAEGEEVLKVPKEAIIRTGSSDRVVLALGEGRFKSIAVKVGRYDEKFAEILSGVYAGDIVVSSAQFLLDSESSKTSDFKRMNSQDEDVSPAPTTVWVEASINSLMAGHRMLNLDHQAIAEWDWPAMTMDFTVADSVDFSTLQPGLTLHVELSKSADGNVEVVTVHIPDSDASQSDDSGNSASTSGVVNSVMAAHRMVNISRGPIEKWNRPAAEVNFMVSDTVDMSAFKVGAKFHFSFENRDGQFIITTIKPMQMSNVSAE
ncbi:efflux RND transporter periplasmic adaptor subunit [Shewanella benthica]|uniref:efflux RND transporter periplasmic adaptor subunit n=1 Tax=Shewanella benthica TaxID=43661 RepID=UPI00187B07C3|nr:efflux RND transporter periplasmic adaptor subunit [Shewanella benthica]MBE7214999.1 efflux RND transporter periplasmic adaptor subunit [Shewanella benthica]MCL1062007.1 efflux RND transporter periplasmic adaptor subunit [Shewanella benthica]